jgi:hypothetical protein
VLKKVTVRLEEEILLWARRRAAKEDSSLSKLIGRMLVDEMRREDKYSEAHERWKRNKPVPVPVLAANRLRRDEANARPQYR